MISLKTVTINKYLESNYNLKAILKRIPMILLVKLDPERF